MYRTNALFLNLLSWVCLSHVFGQPTNQLQLAGDLTADQATAILQAAEKQASSQDILVNIAIAIKKAKTARYFNGPTGDLGKISQPGEAIYNIEQDHEIASESAKSIL